MKRTHCTNAEKLFRHADSFNIAAFVLEAQVRTGRYDFANPCMVYVAFALELYIKCFLAIEGGSYPETHNLETLFKELSPSVQQRLINEHDHFSQIDPLLQAMGKDGMKIDFASLLTGGKHAFQMLRYAFEDKPLGTFGIGGLRQFVRQAILERRPEWEPKNTAIRSHKS